MIHLALVSNHPTEADARTTLLPDYRKTAAYHGVWRRPEPYDAPVHVFSTEAGPVDFIRAGWTREDA